MLPARSVCLAVSVCRPSPSAELVIDQLPEPSAVAVPSTVVPSVSYSVTVAPASAPLPVTVGVVLLVRLSVLDAPLSDAAARSGALGAAAVVSIVTASAGRGHADVAGHVGLLGGQGVIALADSAVAGDRPVAGRPPSRCPAPWCRWCRTASPWRRPRRRCR